MTAMLYTLGVVVFIAALYVSIALHELGHLVVAKKFGCRVNEYMIGFGPTLVKWTRGETDYGIKLIPLGGFVSIIGMFPPKALDVADEVTPGPDGEKTVRLRASNTGMFAQIISDTRSQAKKMITEADSDRLFYKLPWYKKVAVMGAGPAVNLIIAFLCFQSVYALHGVHETTPTGEAVIASISQCIVDDKTQRECSADDELTPAAAMGLKPGDEVVDFNGTTITSWDDLSEQIHDHGDQSVTLGVIRDGQRMDLISVDLVTMERDLSADGSGELTSMGFLGASPVTTTTVTRGGPVYTLDRMGGLAKDSVVAIVTLPVKVGHVGLAILGLEDRDADGPMSVIGGSRVAGEVASASEIETGLDVGDKAAMFGLLTGGFNLFLGLFNLVPLLPLDGGHILGATWEGLRKGLARLFNRKDPGYVDVAAQMPLAIVLGLSRRHGQRAHARRPGCADEHGAVKEEHRGQRKKKPPKEQLLPRGFLRWW